METEEAVAVFLDSNILFSICWSGSKNSLLGLLLELQESGQVQILISPLGIEETRDNLRRKRPAALPALKRLASSCVTVPDAELPLDVKLPEKDQLLLSSAIAARAVFFLTGNIADFKTLYGTSVKGTTVLTPRAFLNKTY
jgi:predicted nucleic acid-binding protein